MTDTAEGIKKFATKVERLCDRLVEGMEHGPDRNAIDALREEAADISTGKTALLEIVLDGIADEIRS